MASRQGSNRRELCRRFGTAPKTGYKWLLRYAQEGARVEKAAAADPSRVRGRALISGRLRRSYCPSGTSSTRRFWARPWSVELLATKSVLP